MHGLLKHCALGALALAAAGCQATDIVVNSPLPKDAANWPIYRDEYSLASMLEDPKGEIIAAVAFSGGGKRSAAFGHGALKGMSKLAFNEEGKEITLLDEIDYISGVSGGTFPAAHYGLYRDKSFATFDHDFLKVDINAYIYGTYLAPWNWAWVFDPYYGTNDRMAEIYDRLMFHGATYADLWKAGLPMISVNATDIANGTTFSFTQTTFDLICSDILDFPIARAVAASNGFPVLFTPITLTSYQSQCQGSKSPLATTATPEELKDPRSRRAGLARMAQRYMDPALTKYVHLMDGGIADNLGLRALINGVIGFDDSSASFGQIALNTRRVLIISVDGEAAADPTLNQEQVVTGLGQIFSAVSGTQIDSYNFETLLLTSAQVDDLVARLKKGRCAVAKMIRGYACDDVKGYVVHISLAGVADPEVRKRLQAIPTGLTIDDADVDALVAWGEKLVLDDKDIRAAVAGLEGKGSPAKAPGS